MPLAPSSTKLRHKRFNASSGMQNLYSILAYRTTSAFDKSLSLSLSYLWNNAWNSLVLSRALARRTADSLVPRATVTVCSAVRVQAKMRLSNFVSTCFPSTGGCPGSAAGTRSRIAVPRCRMKSVQAFVRSLESKPCCSTDSAVFSTSATLMSLFASSRGSAVLRSSEVAFSAVSIRFSRSWTSLRVCSSRSRLLRSSSSFISRSFCLARLICSIWSFAASKPLSSSSCMRCFCVPVFSNSAWRTSFNSLSISSKVSGVAALIFWITRRIERVALCSMRRCSEATSCVRASSSLFRASSSARLFNSSSARRCSARRLCCSSSCFLRISSNWRFFSSNCSLRFTSSSFFRFSSSCRRSSACRSLGFLFSGPKLRFSAMMKDGSTGPSYGTFHPLAGGTSTLSGWYAHTWSPPTFGPNHQPQKFAPSRSSQ
mmetsp:Transcript_69379/g.201016  ORF Transcript_69379/g.201016 Transcript_69379/m.201016 type:complete len:429 (-) Transcript_69379:257-1543(-)